MTPAKRAISEVKISDNGQIVDRAIDDAPTRDDILESICDGYAYVMSGGEGQPIDDVHREIAEELAREEHAQNADISR